MQKFVLFIAVFFCLVRPAGAFEVLVLQSGGGAPYARVAEAFEEEFLRRVPSRGLRTVIPHRFRELVLDRREDGRRLRALVDDFSPDLILALGRRALTAVRDYDGIPVVYALVADPEEIAGEAGHITGVSLTIPPVLQFREVERILPRVKRVGVICSPGHSASLVKRAREGLPGFDFIALEAGSPRDVPALLKELRDRIDLLWLLPDLTVTNRKTLGSYFRFSFRNRVPVLAFSERYLEPGAALSVSFDLAGMGRSAAEMAALIAGGRPVSQVPPREVSRVQTRINPTIMQKLGIQVDGDGR